MRIHLPDGSTAYAYTGGKAFDAALPAAVFVHGALHDHSVWTLLARWFANHGRAVLAVDLPGHGRSTGRPLPSVEAAADWLLALLEAVGAGPRVALVGHSMGSLIALDAAAREPARHIERLVLVGTAFPMRVSPALLDTARDDPQAAIDLVNAFSHLPGRTGPSFPGPGHWLRGGNRALMQRMQAAQPELNLFHHDFTVCDRYAGGLDAAARLRCPTDVVLGRFDQMTPPAHARDLAAAARATVHTLDAGHALMTEAPDALLGTLRGLL